MARYFEEDEQEIEEPQHDTEVTLSWGALAGMGLGLLAICALCFGLGYMVGHSGSAKSRSGPVAPASPSSPPSAPDQEPLQGSESVPKPSASAQAAVTSPPADNTAQSETQGAANPEVPGVGMGAQNGSAPNGPPSQPQVQPALGSDSTYTGQVGTGANVHPAMPSAATLMVQVAAVKNIEDASVLTTALRKRGYPVSEQRDPGDGLIHVRVGPFATAAEANDWRMKLLNDGYNAVVQP